MLRKFLLLAVSISISTALFPQEKLSLQECRRLALEHNNNLKNKSLDINESQLLKKIARNSYLPKFDGLASGVYLPGANIDISIPGFMLPTATSAAEAMKGHYSGLSNTWFPGIDASIRNPSILFGGIMATQPIYMGGKIRKMNKKAEYGIDIYENAYKKEYAEVIEEVDNTYWNLVSLQEGIILGNKYTEAINEILQQVIAMHERGIIPLSDKLKVSVEKDKADIDLLKLENGLMLTRMKLNKLIGKYMLSKTIPSDSLSYEIKLPDFESGISHALENRPEINMLKTSVAVEQLDKKITNAEYLPQIALSVGYFASRASAETSDNMLTGVVAGGMTIPIFHWSEARHKAKISDLKIKKQENVLAETSDLVSLEVQQTITKMIEAKATVNMSSKAILVAEENRDATKESYRLGLNTLADLLKAQAEWQSSRYNYINSLKEFHILQTTWMKVIGEEIFK